MARGRTVRFEFNPFEATGAELPEGADKADALEEAAQFLREEVLNYMGNENSPVAGHGAFPKLSKEYARRKREAGHPAVPNLEFDGDLKDAIQVYPKGNRLVIEVTGAEGAKADGHCNLSGDSSLPLRRFIPDDGEQFKRPILEGIARIIKSGG